MFLVSEVPLQPLHIKPSFEEELYLETESEVHLPAPQPLHLRTLNSQPSTLNPQPSTLHLKP